MGYILIWVTFLGPIVVIEQIMKTADYLNITADKLHHYIVFVSQNGDEIFEQDKTSCHGARIVLGWFQ